VYDTIIVGAGPVGSYLSTKLTHLGYSVLVIDKKASAGEDICCTGIISKQCHDLLNIDGNIPIRQVNSAKFFFPSGRYLRLQRNEEVACVVDRIALDQILITKAQSEGTEYLFSTLVTDIIVENDYVRVVTNNNSEHNEFNAKLAIIATGYGSDLVRNLFLGKINDFIIGAQAEVSINNTEEIEIYLDHKLAPGGFAWLVPTYNGKGLAGLVTKQKQEWHLNRLLTYLGNKNKIEPTDTKGNYGVIPLQPLPKTYSNRLLVVGESAGQIKPTTGGGIYYGIICADIAAKVIHRSLSSDVFSEKMLSSYQTQWRQKLNKELIIGRWARRLWAKLTNRQIEYLYQIALQSKLPEIIHDIKDFPFDWHSTILLYIARTFSPFSRWKNGHL
jgi:digeranylgeranylglycerophospholipid reductase